MCALDTSQKTCLRGLCQGNYDSNLPEVFTLQNLETQNFTANRLQKSGPVTYI